MTHFGQCATESAGQSTFDLQRTNHFQATLLGMAGHDLRQPLQVIQGTYQLLRARSSSKSEQIWLDRGEQAISRLTEQLDHLLGALQIHQVSQTLEILPIALAPLFSRLCNESEDAALRRAIDIRMCSTKAYVASNPVLLGGILGNLVTNAIKYTEPGGRILLGCRRSGSEVRIDVLDSGIGIAPERLSIIFDAFERLDSTRCEGLGLGLFVVRRAVELLGHRIEVKSTISRGSRFSIIAPVPDIAAAENDRAHKEPNGTRSKFAFTEACIPPPK
jgi:two-component system, OmpR family, phosphate regulon sensor histidine kinase PhoR